MTGRKADQRFFANLMQQGTLTWNTWREQNPEVQPDLRGVSLPEAILPGANLASVNLSEADLHMADFSEANFAGADLSKAYLSESFLLLADFRGAKLTAADLSGANLGGASLINVDLFEASLVGANLADADLTGANLRQANLSRATLVETNFKNATLSGCHIFGISAWSVKLEGADQKDLIITPPEEPTIRVDDLEVAQFIYLLLDNENIRRVIDTITSKMVLILGRFTPQRKAVLEAIREKLRCFGYLPVLFDFEKPSTRDTHETITTLARLARFVIADITGPRSVPQELVSIVQQLPSVPVQPLLTSGSKPWGMYDHIKRYPWVLRLFRYKNVGALRGSLRSKVIDPPEQAAKKLQKGAK